MGTHALMRLLAFRMNPEIAVTLLTGGGDKPYVFGLATALLSNGVALDLVGSDELECPEFHGRSGMNFLNLRGDQQRRHRCMQVCLASHELRDRNDLLRPRVERLQLLPGIRRLSRLV